MYTSFSHFNLHAIETKCVRNTGKVINGKKYQADLFKFCWSVSQDMQCEVDMDLLCWGSGELGQTGHGRPEVIPPEEALLKEFATSGLGSVKLLACGSSHSVVVTGSVPSLLV